MKVSFLTVGANVHNNFFFWYDSFPDIGVTELHIVTELRTVTELPLPQTLSSLCRITTQYAKVHCCLASSMQRCISCCLASLDLAFVIFL